jgi:NAD(P)-dependent dehydrogenase (short-subunit alcohol dehydrogenase family)
MSGMSEPLRVMVTAGAAGIGAAIAAAFLDDGARVSVTDVDDDAMALALGSHPELHGVVCDVADEHAVDAWFGGVLAAGGGLDVLVNNAGIAGPTAYVEDVSYDEWRQCLAVGLDAQFLTSRRAARVMKDQGAGSIINISSTAGLVGYGMRTPYASAKWAVIGLTKSLAIELGAFGVRVNAICPGSVDGPRMRGVIAREAQVRGVDTETVSLEYTAGQSISRFVQPGEIADLCRFLASPAASMISGQAIAVDGHTETFHLG